MNTRLARPAGWAAYLSGIAAVLGLASLVLFFSLESAPSTAQAPHLWGPVSDIAPILQMVSLLIVALGLYRIERSKVASLSLIGSTIGILGMLGVILLQLFLIIKVITFEQEILPVLVATGTVGIWLILVNFSSRRQQDFPTRLAGLGMAVGAAFVLEPVMLTAAGGAIAWRVFMSNYFLLAVSAVVFLVSYVGFPVWAFWLGRLILRAK